MSQFQCQVVNIAIESHPNADAIEIARVGDYLSIVKKGQFKDGDLAVYIPEQAILPQWLLEEMGFWDSLNSKGKLSGSAGNRVRAMKLRGVLSQGLLYPVKRYSETEVLVDSAPVDGNYGSGIVRIGEDASECMGIVKYEPEVPSHMVGRLIRGVHTHVTHNYDIENLKKMPDLFDAGELVVITEKIHGTNIQIGVVPSDMKNSAYYEGRVFVTSKGQGAKGFILDHNDASNLYIQAAKQIGLLDSALSVFGTITDETDEPVLIFGEVFGKTAGGGAVQDLTYTGETLGIRIFDIATNVRNNARFANWPILKLLAQKLGVEIVPTLYEGPYSKEKVLELTDGLTTLVAPRGQLTHIREGVVVKPFYEKKSERYGQRKIAKSISEKYLLRKSGTEFN